MPEWAVPFRGQDRFSRNRGTGVLVETTLAISCRRTISSWPPSGRIRWSRKPISRLTDPRSAGLDDGRPGAATSDCRRTGVPLRRGSGEAGPGPADVSPTATVSDGSTLSAAKRAPLPLPDKPSLLVLPFQNISGDPEQQYFADGMVEEITTALSRVRSLSVIARNSAFTYEGRAIDVPARSGRELGVRYVLEGSVRQAGLRVRIASQLVETANGTHLWADRFESTLEDVFDLQDRVAASVAAAIEFKSLRCRNCASTAQAGRPPGLRPTPAGDAAYTSAHSGERNPRRNDCCRRLLRIDPDYAPAMARLATCHWIMVSQNWVDRADPMHVREMVQLARAAHWRWMAPIRWRWMAPIRWSSTIQVHNSPAGWRPQRWYHSDQQID